MNTNKCGLDPLVECSEPCEQEESSSTENDQKPEMARKTAVDIQRRTPDEFQRSRVRATSSKSTDGVRPKKYGSRISLASLFSFSGHSGLGRERSKSGWSYSDDGTVAMTSVSASDIRSAVAGPLSSKRYRGSDTGSCMDGGNEHCADALLQEEDEEEAVVERKESKESKKEAKQAIKMKECPLCATKLATTCFPKLKGCQHRSCRLCLRQYVELSINENRVEVPCPECTSVLHPSDISLLLGDMPELIEKYEQFSLRKFLLTEADARWCPAPDCGYAVIASKCAACPQLQCQRPECQMLFCYHCKREWHNNQTCDEARRQEKYKARALGLEELIQNNRNNASDSALKPGDVKSCPRCRTYIVKMDDGSCNHMVCAMCNAEFCWLCLKEISDLHYLSPTGCTFWGKKPWTRKKKLLWQLGTLIGAPLGIALIAGLSVPGIIFGVPVFVGRKVHQRFRHKTKAKRRIFTITCVVGSLVVSPVMAVMAVGVGVPIMLAYVYGVVPLSLCRNGGCGLTSANSELVLNTLDEEQLYGTEVANQLDFVEMMENRKDEVISIDPSLHSGLSVPHDVRSYQHTPFSESSRRRTSLESGERVNYEEASVKAMAGSHYYDDKSLHTLCSGHEVISIADEQASTKALAGSAIETKSLSESVYRHLLAKHVEKGVDSEVDEQQQEGVTSTTASTRQDEAPSSSSSSANKNKPSSSGFKACAIEQGEEVLLLSEEAAALLLNSSMRSNSTSGSQTDSHIDLFKIRSWLDNMKQMVASDVPIEKPYEPAPSSSRILRSGSGKSVHTVTTLPMSSTGKPSITLTSSHTSMPEASNVCETASISSTNSKRKKRLGFFSNWFNKSK